MGKDNVAILAETLWILNQGAYEKNGKIVPLQLSRDQMEASHVLLPNNVRDVCSREPRGVHTAGECKVCCLKMDSFEAAVNMTQERKGKGESKNPVLVLNFANPVNIGGGVYKGARAQEEDLCRRSSLLRSLESKHALHYYQYNRAFHTYLGTDAMIFSPEVEVFRDEYCELMQETIIVAVLTCAAPLISYGLEGLSEREYRGLFYNRIVGMLKCAAYFGYENLVLGAWGCGAFGNDAAVVSDLFYQAMEDIQAKNLFRRIVFAVRSKGEESYNFREFSRNFGSK